ncbi:MAG: efflux RND transporter periplasmic adaptor subunit [Mitsuaria chitosanitabida]|uniref:efflux RND transporter periplasmic adaptor subunit n=1 Tax=Roseateles chitosanitabidus TaxID=65048 RepID=UPI001B1132CD|nr:efflux RND transporter periplasmic adaptor subunit [Roseateles chitosanitabidus]MBO9688494.1 efflux RND transporter periplasmic adaptor subunit [Roseateles chitosanitabidus]
MIRDTSGQDRPLERSHGRRRLWLALAGAGLLVAAFAAAPAVQRMMGSGNSVSLSRLGVAAVEIGPLVRDVAGEGKVVAAMSPTVYALHGGNLVLRVKAGDKVTKNQLLGEIDSPDLRAKLAQERSNADALRTEALRAEVDGREQRAALRSTYENAGIDLQTARNDLARQTKAFEAGAVAGMQVEKARDALEKARITAAHAEAGLGLKDDSLKFELQAKQQALQRQQLLVQDLERQVAELELRSPVDGQVGQLLVAERANVAAGAGLLTVVDLTALEVQMQVPESFARDLAIGMPGEISGNGRQWRGLVSTVSPEVVNNEVAARIRFDGATPDQLRQNQRLSVRVLLDKRDKVLTVARGSFVEEGGGRFAYVVEDGQAVKRPIRLGAQSLSKVEVLEGLKPGDKVVVSGGQAFDGAERVTLSP